VQKIHPAGLAGLRWAGFSGESADEKQGGRNMLTGVIRAYLAKRIPPSPAWPFRLPDLATAALMVECARIDGAFAEGERDAICCAVMDQLALDEETAECLVSVAEMREDAVWHDWLFTETIRKSFDRYDRLAVIQRLWEVALADGTVHPFEEILVNRIAAALEIPEEAVGHRLSMALRRHSDLTRLTLDAATRPSP
jgi:uncharacterized tellurite resistance protein B-like protein